MGTIEEKKIKILVYIQKTEDKKIIEIIGAMIAGFASIKDKRFH